jgi:ATP-dependent DNA helicase RecG
MTLDALKAPHKSMPWNPLLAGVFYRAGIIENWGSGTMRMIEACRGAGRPSPVWESEVEGLRLVLPSPRLTPEVTPEVRALLVHCREPSSRKELQALLGLKDPDRFRLAYLQPALEAGLIEMTIPDKPNSRLRRYRVTASSLQVIKGDQ